MNSAIRKGLALLTALLLTATPGVRTRTAEAALSGPEISDRLRATDKALRWLDAQQNVDGGFGDGGSDPLTTCEVILAFGSAYEEPDTVQESGNSPLDYLATQVVSYTNSAEGTARLVLAVVAGNEDPNDFRGSNLISFLTGYYESSTGQYTHAASDGIAAQALALLALEISFEAVPPDAVIWLKNQQNPDGGWGPDQGQASDTESTALALQALAAVGESPVSNPLQEGIAYLEECQTQDAGFATSASLNTSDPTSTARAIQALLAAGENLLSPVWSQCLRTPFDALMDYQLGDGSFESATLVTAASTPGLMGRPLPLPGRRLAALKALEWLGTQQQSDGGFGNGGITADAVYAIALTGQNPDGLDWTKDDTSALDALEAETPGYIAVPDGEPAGELSKVTRAVQQAGGDPGSFAGMDLIYELGALYNPGTGQYHPFKVYSHDLALVAIHAVGEIIPSGAVSALESAQLDAGGWSWGWGFTSADVDSTGLSMQAIVAGGGPSSPSITEDAAGFLEGLRFPGGGYPDLATRPEPNCDSTSLAIQGLLASGKYRQQPLLFALETGALGSSWDALLAFQEDTGSFVPRASVPGDLLNRLLATVEAVHALASPLYPAYQPLAEGDPTAAGSVYGRLTCGSGLGVVAPYSGDDDNDGSASLRYAAGETSWSGWIEMDKGGLHYVELLDLEVGTEYELEVSYADPDGVSAGQETQSLSLYMGKACIPFAARSYSG